MKLQLQYLKISLLLTLSISILYCVGKEPEVKNGFSNKRITYTRGVVSLLSDYRKFNKELVYITGYLGFSQLPTENAGGLILASNPSTAQDGNLGEDIIYIKLKKQILFHDVHKLLQSKLLGQYVGVRGEFRYDATSPSHVVWTIENAEISCSKHLNLVSDFMEADKE